jgi:hypothetical protein
MSDDHINSGRDPPCPSGHDVSRRASRKHLAALLCHARATCGPGDGVADGDAHGVHVVAPVALAGFVVAGSAAATTATRWWPQRPGRSPVLHHGADDQDRAGSGHPHRRGRLDPDPLPNAIWDEEEQRLISDAQVAEIPFTAFTGRRRSEHVTARLIVRRVKRLNPAPVTKPAAPQPDNQQAGPVEQAVPVEQAGQGELFYRVGLPRGVHRLTLLDAGGRNRPSPARGRRGRARRREERALAHLPSIILSSKVDHGSELGGCVVDGVLDVVAVGLRSVGEALVGGGFAGRVAAGDPVGALVSQGACQGVA